MAMTSVDPGSQAGEDFRIGAPSHARRNLAILVAVLGMGGVIAVHSLVSARREAAQLAVLEQFRSAYAERCGASGFSGAAPPMVRDAYIGSAKLQDVVARQMSALGAGMACDDITRALRAADFPLQAPAPGDGR